MDGDIIGNPATRELITLPDVRRRTVREARNLLSDFNVHISGEEDEEATIITEQLPHPGVSLFRGSDIFLSTENNNARISVTVPDLRGSSLTQARSSLANRNLNIVFTGNGVVRHQDPPPGADVPQGTVVNVTLGPELTGVH